MVGDDIHDHLHAARMRGIDQPLDLGVAAQMRIDLGEIVDPVAVITGATLPRCALHRLVLEDRGDPDRGDAHALTVVEPLAPALEVTVAKKPLAAGVEPGVTGL